MKKWKDASESEQMAYFCLYAVQYLLCDGHLVQARETPFINPIHPDSEVYKDMTADLRSKKFAPDPRRLIDMFVATIEFNQLQMPSRSFSGKLTGIDVPDHVVHPN